MCEREQIKEQTFAEELLVGFEKQSNNIKKVWSV
jgi:hypothetical protein